MIERFGGYAGQESILNYHRRSSSEMPNQSTIDIASEFSPSLANLASTVTDLKCKCRLKRRLLRCAAHRDRLSRVVTAALLSEVAEVVALPDLRSEVPEDGVRNRDVEEEVGQHQVPDVVVAAEPPAHDRRS